MAIKSILLLNVIVNDDVFNEHYNSLNRCNGCRNHGHYLQLFNHSTKFILKLSLTDNTHVDDNTDELAGKFSLLLYFLDTAQFNIEERAK